LRRARRNDPAEEPLCPVLLDDERSAARAGRACRDSPPFDDFLLRRCRSVMPSGKDLRGRRGVAGVACWRLNRDRLGSRPGAAEQGHGDGRSERLPALRRWTAGGRSRIHPIGATHVFYRSRHLTRAFALAPCRSRCPRTRRCALEWHDKYPACGFGAIRYGDRRGRFRVCVLGSSEPTAFGGRVLEAQHSYCEQVGNGHGMVAVPQLADRRRPVLFHGPRGKQRQFSSVRDSWGH
jgi:hypothetical protein